MAIKFDPDKALLIVLGASSWPKHDKYKEPSDNDKSVLVSATKVKEYFTEKVKLQKIEYLFNEETSASAQLERIRTFLKESELEDGDLFVYYAGHGVSEKGDYYLFVKQTTSNLSNTAISMTSLVDTLRSNARYKRWYFIIDACQSGIVRKIMPELGETCKETVSDSDKRGTVLFCASSESECAEKNSPDKPTLFTETLLEVLKKGVQSDQKYLSCNEINTLLNKYLEEENKKIPEPQYHVIGKYQRIIGNLRIFPNLTPRPVGNIIESLPYSMDDIERLPQIKWHITTSNKGGVGKTLLSMMLLTNYSKETPEGNENLEILDCPLVIDLNGVNTDLKRLLVIDNLLEKNKVGKAKFVELKNEKIVIVKVNQEKHPFFLGWMKDDPFKMLNASSFFNLLMAVKGEGIGEIKKKFGNNFDVNTVIIDTNYHFCNIFSDRDDDYRNKGLKDFLWDRDLFFIWFIWVYGQIRNSNRKEIQGISSVSDISRMGKVSTCVEKYLTSSKMAKESPFFHVINPMGLEEKDTEIEKQSLISRWFFGHSKKSEDKNQREKLSPLLLQGQVIPELEAITGLDVCEGKTRFAEMQNLLRLASPKFQETNNLNTHERDKIKNMLGELKKILEERIHGRPKNLIPISVHHELLKSYQDYEHVDLKDLEELGIYLKFKEKKILGKL